MSLTPEQQAAIEEQKKHCPFCQIVSGGIPSQKVYEDDIILAILDINPARPGHLLVMPKEHYPILPLVPPETQVHLYTRIAEIGKHLRSAMVVPQSTVFVANGGAAGQQAAHFLLHVIPSEKPLENFRLVPGSTEDAQHAQIAAMLSQNLPLMLKERTKQFPLAPSTRETPLPETPTPTPPTPAQPSQQDLATMITEHPELREAIMNNPDAVIAGIQENPSLQPLFAGVDVHALSEQLKALAQQANTAPPPEELTPIATELTDEELVAFIEEKPKLQELLLYDVKTLKDAINAQPKLQQFFAGTTPEDVAQRYINITQPQDTPSRRYTGGNE